MKTPNIQQLMTQGPSWTMAVYAIADGCNYYQYQQRCFGGGQMSIDNGSYNQCAIALAEYRKNTNEPTI